MSVASLSAADLPLLGCLLHLGDSALPVGGFTCSCAMESAVQENLVHDLPTLRAFLQSSLEQLAHGDALGLAAVARATTAGDLERIFALDQLMHARKPNEELRRMSRRMGRALTDLGCDLTEDPCLRALEEAIRQQRTPGLWPTALGVLGTALGASPAQCAGILLYSGAATLCNAALRLLRVTPRDIQRLLHEATTQFATLGALACAEDMLPERRMHGFTPMLDILGAAHVRAQVRLFMN